MSLDFSLICKCCNREIFEINITHNLGKMASEAKIYKHLWSPEEVGIKYAGQLIKPLKRAIRDLEARPCYYKKYNASNGWGLYKHFVPFVKDIFKACVQDKKAIVEISK